MINNFDFSFYTFDKQNTKIAHMSFKPKVLDP